MCARVEYRIHFIHLMSCEFILTLIFRIVKIYIMFLTKRFDTKKILQFKKKEYNNMKVLLYNYSKK